MSANPLVSIVTPSFNQAAYLERTILSVLEQDYSPIEYLIIDGQSTDSSVGIIQKYAPRLAYFVSEPDRGQTDALNKGFSRGRGEIFAWLNSDDTYLAGTVMQAVDYLTSHPDIDLVYGDAHFINSNDQVVGRFPAAQTDYQRLRRGFVHIPQQAAFFRASAWRRAAPLDPSLYFAMDYELWLKIARCGGIHYRPGFWANFRLHQDAKTIKADERCWDEMRYIHYRDGGSLFAALILKYHLRKLAAPFLALRRRIIMSR
jgi:glycosyltransferase involved in cell wall biosynthesis